MATRTKAPRRGARRAPRAVRADGPSAGCAILSFLLPPVGGILYFRWQRRAPQRARSCAQGLAVAGIVAGIFLVMSLLSTAALLPRLMSVIRGLS